MNGRKRRDNWKKPAAIPHAISGQLKTELRVLHLYGFTFLLVNFVKER